jgi:hypothetical protein
MELAGSVMRWTDVDSIIDGFNADSLGLCGWRLVCDFGFQKCATENVVFPVFRQTLLLPSTVTYGGGSKFMVSLLPYCLMLEPVPDLHITKKSNSIWSCLNPFQVIYHEHTVRSCDRYICMYVLYGCSTVVVPYHKVLNKAYNISK